MWVSKFEGAAKGVHGRLSVVHMVSTSCWECNVVLNVEIQFSFEREVLISGHSCTEVGCRVHTSAVTQQSVS